jgi:hypothetical protein
MTQLLSSTLFCIYISIMKTELREIINNLLGINYELKAYKRIIDYLP